MDREEERLKSTNRDMVRFNWAVRIKKNVLFMKLLLYLKSNQFVWFVIINVSCLC
jgi:hypothetical protein